MLSRLKRVESLIQLHQELKAAQNNWDSVESGDWSCKALNLELNSPNPDWMVVAVALLEHEFEGISFLLRAITDRHIGLIHELASTGVNQEIAKKSN